MCVITEGRCLREYGDMSRVLIRWMVLCEEHTEEVTIHLLAPTLRKKLKSKCLT